MKVEASEVLEAVEAMELDDDEQAEVQRLLKEHNVYSALR